MKPPAIIRHVGTRDLADALAVARGLRLSAAGLFHADGRQVICGNGSDRSVSVFNLAKARVVAHLPVAVEPENFCFKADNGGELYVTGAGMDAVVVIYPYQSYVSETRLVGRSPGAMEVSSSQFLVLRFWILVSSPGPETGD